MSPAALLLALLLACGGSTAGPEDQVRAQTETLFQALERGDCEVLGTLVEKDCAEMLEDWDRQAIELRGIVSVEPDARAKDIWLVECAISVRGKPRAQNLLITVRREGEGWRMEL